MCIYGDWVYVVMEDAVVVVWEKVDIVCCCLEGASEEVSIG